ncbi:hypothetical protein QBC35DRAFT_421463, partial [Podospora australis]
MDFAAAAAKRRYDGKHRDLSFEPGDKQRAGPFTVLKKVGRLAYKLDLPESFGIHPVISVAQLTPSPKGSDPFGRELPPPGPVEDSQSDSGLEEGDRYETEIILDHR